jgi:phosphatidylethanolamine-binding protein (PEBP) family uncharacterized protein
MRREQDLVSSIEYNTVHRSHRLAPLALLLLASAVVFSAGCGESNSTPTAAASASATVGGAPAPSAASTAGASSGTSSTRAAGSVPAGSSSVGGSSAREVSGQTRRSRAHLVLPPAGSHPAPRLSASEREDLPVSDIALSSPAIARTSSASIAGRFTCHGEDRSPPLQWSGIPAGTKELALFVMNTTPVNGELFFDWAVAGLSPTITGLQTGQLPAGAILGRNGFGHTTYSICPPSSKRESYVFMLYALPASLSPKPNFDPNSLRKEALHLARHSGLLAGTYG